MKRLWIAFAVTGLLVGGSVVPSQALTCSGTCTESGLIFTTGNGGYQDLFPGTNPQLANGSTFTDQYGFSLIGPPPFVYNSFTDTIDIVVPINHLTLSIWQVGAVAPVNNTYAFGPAVGVPFESVVLTLTNALLPGVNYFIQVTGDYSPGISYTGLQNVTAGTLVTTTPIPAALPLFATGLGLIGVWGRRRRNKDKSATNQQGMVAC
jgi:hypothetical protein